MSGLKRLLSSSRTQFGLAAIVATLVLMFLKWPTLPPGTTDEQLLVKVAEIQQGLLASAFKAISVIVAVLAGGTSLEDAARKLIGGERRPNA